MKRLDYLLAIAAAFTLSASTAVAQQSALPTVQVSEFSADYYAQPIQEDSPSDRLTDVSAASIINDDGGCGADACGGGDCDTCCCGSGGWLADTLPCNPCRDEALRLFPCARRGWEIYGWVSGGVTFNADHPLNHFNGPVTFNDRDRDFQVNQVYVVLEKPLDPDCCGWQIGGRADLLFGTDARFSQAVGLELDSQGNFDLNRGRRFYHLALPQFYVEVGKGRLSAIAGHFYTIIGYETVTATGNFFYSHAYTMQYGEPFTHSGFLVKYQATDQLEIKAGMHNGWDVWERSNSLIGDHQGFLGSIGWTSCDERATLNVAYSWGREFDSDIHDRNIYSIVGTYQVSDRVEYVIQHDNGWQVNSSINEPVEWYGINQYLFYTINDCWKAGVRMEWFRDDDGFRVSGVDMANPTFNQSFAGDFYELTCGLNWTPCPNVTIRPEVRWDWFNPGSGATNPFPFSFDGNVGTEDEQFLFAVDGIVTW